jgi:hypothetical protein
MLARTSKVARAVLTVLAFPALSAGAQGPSAPPPHVVRSTAAQFSHLQIPRLAREPKLEDFAGMEPSPAVAGMLKIDRFWQRDPHDGQPVSQCTEAYLGYTDRALYFIFLAFDERPRNMRAHLVRREQINDEDQVGVWLDTFHDKRHAVFFFINPRAIQQEGSMLEGGDFDLSWDTVWTSESKILPQGWIGYIAVPFRSLRFRRSAAMQEWGFILERDIPNNSGEHSFFPRNTPTQQGLLSQEGTLGGFEQISPGRNIQLVPYASFRSARVLDLRDPAQAAFVAKPAEVKAGLDSKFVLKDSLVLDATVNPDFGQVESDDPQVTVNQRFEVFFPEKRPFFQENSGYFNTPINLVFTRRMADPLYGVRLTGKLGRWSVGTLFADDQSPGEGVVPGDPMYGRQSYFSVLRISREFGQRGSSIGFIYTDRELHTARQTSCNQTALASLFEQTDPCITSMNRVGGFDTHLKFNINWQLDGQAVTSQTRLNDGTYLAGPAYKVFLERSSRKLEFNSLYLDNSPGFDTKTGFFQRPDIRWFSNDLERRFYVEGKHLLWHGPGLYTRNIWDHAGRRIEYFANPSYRIVFTARTEFDVYGNYGHERLRPVDFSTLLADRDYPHYQTGVKLNSDYFKWLGLKLELNRGQDTNYTPALGPPVLGKSRFANADVTLRLGTGLTVENTYLYTALRDVHTGLNMFNSHVARSKWNYQFTPRFSLRLIGQYNANLTNTAFTTLQHAKSFNGDVLFTYMVHPGTALYVGYNSDVANIDRSLLPDPAVPPELLRSRSGFINDGRQVFVKLSYLFRF